MIGKVCEFSSIKQSTPPPIPPPPPCTRVFNKLKNDGQELWDQFCPSPHWMVTGISEAILSYLVLERRGRITPPPTQQSTFGAWVCWLQNRRNTISLILFSNTKTKPELSCCFVKGVGSMRKRRCRLPNFAT